MKIKHNNVILPKITGGKKGGGKIAPNSLFSTDILYLLNAFGEGPLYRINPNGPQDIEINDSVIDDLLILDDTDVITGDFDINKFHAASVPGTIEQPTLELFSDSVIIPQAYSSAVKLKKGNIAGVPESNVTNQDTSAGYLDAIRFVFIIDELYRANSKGNVNPYTVSIKIVIKYLDTDENSPTNGQLVIIDTINKTISEKTDTPYKFTIKYNIPDEYKNKEDYRFDIEKTSDDSDDPKKADSIKFIGWDEIINDKLRYPRTALIGYAIKAADEHTGGVPNFTSLLKGLIVKVPSNYNQPISENGQIDWRHVEIPSTGSLSLSSKGYYLQDSDLSLDPILDGTPQIYKGVWDGTFSYAWTQNPVWIVFDILTNDVYGLGLPEANIDKYKFYQVAQYCDACDSDGIFVGVDGLADGSFRYKPLDYLNTLPRQNQFGLPEGTKIKERRFISDLSITDQESVLDLLNKITSTFRGILIYAGGKITLAVDMPEEYPVMLFNDSNIQKGSIQLSGTKESEMLTGIDASYIEPTNHFKREVITLRADEDVLATRDTSVEKIKSIDMMGVTRRSQAMRMAQYQLAASKYVKRMISFNAGADAAFLAPGDVIAVATNTSGIVYGYGGRIASNSSTDSTQITLEHFTSPSINDSTFSTSNSLILRVLKSETDDIDLYVVSKTNYSLVANDVYTGYDTVTLNVTKKGTLTNGSLIFSDITTLDTPPQQGDLWSLGEIEDINNYYSNKSDKLFKVLEVSRDPEEFIIKVNAIEYISEVYEDSDSFINYEPVAYVDYQSAITTPPVPRMSLQTRAREKEDGTYVADLEFNTVAEQDGYTQSFSTEYYRAYPDVSVGINDIVSTSPFIVEVDDVDGITIGDKVTVAGKNGFSTPIGKIDLFCTEATAVGSASIRLYVPGLSLCIDDNFTAYNGYSTHILNATNTLPSSSLYGLNKIDIGIKKALESEGEQNFVGYFSNISTESFTISDIDLNNDYIYIDNASSGTSNSLFSKLESVPFCTTITQPIVPTIVDTTSYYIKGDVSTHVQEGIIPEGDTSITIDLEVEPLHVECITAYVDGQIKDVTANLTSTPNTVTIDNLITGDQFYRLEVIFHAKPAIEVGDTVEAAYNNTFIVVGTSYDSNSSYYDATLTNNNIFKIYTSTKSTKNLSGYYFVNTKQDVVGLVTDIDGNNITLDTGTSNVSNYFMSDRLPYRLTLNEDYERVFVDNAEALQDVPVGNISIKARNRNSVGRVSPFTTARTYIETLPIRKVDNLEIVESLVREQLGGVSVSVTCIFDHIQNQQVTEYEISYAITYYDSDSLDYNANLEDYNTVQVSASGVGSDNKIRFTIPNVNRGTTSEANYITFRITPLNKNIRGVTAYTSKTIIGKTAPPANIIKFTGGQQDTLLTFFWDYVRISGESGSTEFSDLADPDLESVLIYRIPGDLSAYNQTQLFEILNNAKLLVTVSAGSRRKSVPIDTYGDFTYLARTKDTSGNFSSDIVLFYLKTTRPKKTGVIAAYNEDNPSVNFTDITNTNASEDYYPSFNEPGASTYGGYTEGFSVLPEPTDLLAEGLAEYRTKIRDFGSIVTSRVNIEVVSQQLSEKTFLDFYTTLRTSVSQASGSNDLLVDNEVLSGIGIGTYLEGSTYDSNQNTLVRIDPLPNGKITRVFAILAEPGVGEDYGWYGLIQEIVDANTIRFSKVYDNNGIYTGSNTFAELAAGESYTLIDLNQYADLNSSESYLGASGVAGTSLQIRTSSANKTADLLVDSDFDGYAVDNGYLPYEAGARTFRHLQIKMLVNNLDVDNYDLQLDKFRYTLEKEETIYTDTLNYTGSAYTVDYSEYDFIYRPTLSYTIASTPSNDLLTVLTTAADNTSATFTLYYSNGSGEYLGNAEVMITAIGV